MTPDDFSFALARLGWSQTAFAKYAGYSAKTMSHWMTQKSSVPVIVEKHLHLLLTLREHLPS